MLTNWNCWLRKNFVRICKLGCRWTIRVYVSVTQRGGEDTSSCSDSAMKHVTSHLMGPIRRPAAFECTRRAPALGPRPHGAPWQTHPSTDCFRIAHYSLVKCLASALHSSVGLFSCLARCSGPDMTASHQRPATNLTMPHPRLGGNHRLCWPLPPPRIVYPDADSLSTTCQFARYLLSHRQYPCTCSRNRVGKY